MKIPAGLVVEAVSMVVAFEGPMAGEETEVIGVATGGALAGKVALVTPAVTGRECGG